MLIISKSNNYEYTENECYTYFKNELYKKDRITNNLIKGDFLLLKNIKIYTYITLYYILKPQLN